MSSVEKNLCKVKKELKIFGRIRFEEIKQEINGFSMLENSVLLGTSYSKFDFKKGDKFLIKLAGEQFQLKLISVFFYGKFWDFIPKGTAVVAEFESDKKEFVKRIIFEKDNKKLEELYALEFFDGNTK